MRVGLLECDHVDPRFLEAAGGDYLDMFRGLMGAATELVPYDVVEGKLPSGPGECDAWMCTGSRHSVYEDREWIGELAAFVRSVRDADVPFAGVCFGHQMLAHALGGRVEKAPGGWGAGVHPIHVDAAETWMDPRREELALHFMHQDQVTEVPDGGVVLGRTDHCAVAMFRVGERMVGIQAHPEFVAAYTDVLLDDRTMLIGDETVAAAKASLSTPTDEAVVGQWLAAFLRGAA